MTDESTFAASEALVAQLVEAGRTLAVAESCTGGWIAKAITDVGGSSAAFGFGVVSYSNEAKQQVLGVAATTLANHGAVSEAVVREMAEGVLRVSGADCAVAVSGIAGPGGGSLDKPVGTVWLAWSGRGGPEGDSMRTEAECQLLTGDRHAIRAQTVRLALNGLLHRLQTGSL